MATYVDEPYDPDEQWGRTCCTECGRSFVELLVPHKRSRPTLTCSSYCAGRRAARMAARRDMWADIGSPQPSPGEQSAGPPDGWGGPATEELQRLDLALQAATCKCCGLIHRTE